jgi:hypothetical protein
MDQKRLREPQEILPAYEPLEHMVRRVVREELEPVLDILKKLRPAEVAAHESGFGSAD